MGFFNSFLSKYLYARTFCVVIIFLLTFFDRSLSAQTTEANSSDSQKRYLLLAESLYREGEFQYALSLYLDFMELYPDSKYRTQALETLASIYEKEQRHQEALQTYRILYQDAGISNKGLGYLYHQARILSLMGERARAEKIYREIIRISPEGPYARKAKINSKLGRLFEETDEAEDSE